VPAIRIPTPVAEPRCEGLGDRWTPAPWAGWLP